ncbi:MAG: amino acid permease [Methylacidiphilales bacterium]|nr:amino acid permease [Candidatus Methylacidiphilales bacterium]
MNNQIQKDGVTYSKAESGYFEQRGLNRVAGKWLLYGLGIAAVISGDFSGWNFGIGEGGFGGLLIATFLIGAMYVGLAFSLSELSPALPHTGGAYSFARTAMGPWGGFITGLAENMEYVITTAVVGTFMVGYAQELLPKVDEVSVIPDWALLLFIYGAFLILNIIHVQLSLVVALVVAGLSVLALAVFFIAAATTGTFSVDNLFNIVPAEGGTAFLPFGTMGLLYAMPFAVWLFLGLEQLPLAAEESHDPKKDIPFALILGILTLFTLAILVVVLNTGVVGAEQIKAEGEPFFVGLTTVFQGNVSRTLLALTAIISFVASFHAIMFAYGRNIYSLSRAGYFPTALSKTLDKNKTPAVALITGAIIGYALVIIMWKSFYSEQSLTAASGILLNMAVFGAMIAYISQAVSYLIIKKMVINRPYVSPLGNAGAWVATIISTGTTLIILSNVLREGPGFDSYRWGLLGCVLWFIIGSIYFAVHAKNKMILSPEEEFAIEHRKS